MDPKPKAAEMSAISGATVPGSPFAYTIGDDCVAASEDDDDDDGEEESPEVAVPLDENGFPFPDAADLPLPPEEEDEDDLQNGENSFAADFYSSGSDWSSLLLEGTVDVKKKKMMNDWGVEMQQSDRKLKQANLFQMWGLKKTHLSDDASSMQQPKKKMKIESGVGVGFGFGGSKSGDSVDNFVNYKGSQMRRKSDGASAPANRLRPCPFYKKIPGTPFTVDAFRYGRIEGCLAYFLSHFHYDHYGGLTKKWAHGRIYCTPLTARLVKMCLSVDPLFIHSLDLNIEYIIEGVKVTMLEANHCPGAALIHLRLPNGQTYLHTGDFRASKLMQAYPLLVNHRVNVLYLDTTYCNPKYKFPPKEDVLNYVVKVTENHLKRQPKTLIIVGAYSIGKECVYLAISKALGVKIYANASRRRILQSFGFPELSGNLCNHGQDTLLHVLPISSLRAETLKEYLKTYQNQYKSVLAFRPTGWTFSEAVGNQLDLIKPISKGNITVYGVPYSEHSSFTELRDFVQFLRPEKIIPTVNVGNAAHREKMQSCFREWLRRITGHLLPDAPTLYSMEQSVLV